MVDFKLVLVIVEVDRSSQVLQAALESGATGATILSSARGVGISKNVTFFGLDLSSPREVLLVLVENRRVDRVLKAVEEAGKLDESLGTGIALQISVDKAVGLTEHIKVWEQRFADSPEQP